MCLSDTARLRRIKWSMLVVDESHRLKNAESRLFLELMKFRREFCVLLTGTPIQNTLIELWTLLHFIDAKSFSSMDEFQEEFGDLKNEEDVNKLHDLLRPYFLR